MAFAPEEAEGGYIAGSTGEGSGPPQNVEVMIPVGTPTFTGSVVFKNGLIAGNKKIGGVADPEYSYDAANKAYVDSKASALKNELSGGGTAAKKLAVPPSKITIPDPDAPVSSDSYMILDADYDLSNKAVFVVPDPGSAGVVKSCNVRCTSCGETYIYPLGTKSYLKFECDTKPAANVTFNVLIMPVS